MKIRIIGYAAVFDSDENEIEESKILRNLDGIKYDEEFQTDYIGGTEFEDNLKKN